jgi:HSP20 family protein
MHWEPNDFERFRDDVNRFWGRVRDDWNLDQTRPRTHLHRTETGYLAEFELPGVDPEAMNIEVDTDSMSVTGQFPASPLEQDKRTGESFSAVVNFPTEIDPDTAEAEYRHGLLSVKVHRSQAKRRQISIAPQH